MNTDVIPAPQFMGTAPEQRILLYFLEHSIDNLGIERSQRAYGISDSTLNSLCRNVTELMISPEFDHAPAKSWSSRASSIKDGVDGIISKMIPDANELLRERLLIQGIYDWTRTHVLYNDYLTDMSVDREWRKKHWTAGELSQMKRPNAVCSGYSNVLQEMGQAFGLECWVTNGAIRVDFSNERLLFSGPVELLGGHQWVIFKQKDGFIIPVDPSRGTVKLFESPRTQRRYSR